VAVARPTYLDLETTPVSEGVRRIVDFINAHPKCNRRKLIEALVPSPAPAPIPVTPAEGEANSPAPGADEPTTEQAAMIGDLHWLVHQGHVIEFASGLLETAKRPAPKLPKPEPKPAVVAPSATSAPVRIETPITEATAPVSEPVAEVSSSPSPETSIPSSTATAV